MRKLSLLLSLNRMAATTMASFESKYLVFGSGNSVEWRSRTLKSKSGHVLVEVHAAGINPVDAKRSIGDKLPKQMGGFSSYLVKGTNVGFEFSGRVVADSDCGYKEGDSVYGSMPPFGGTFSDFLLVPEHHLAPKPASLSFEEAACLPLVGLTAVQALKEYTESKTICIVGASGGTGHVAVQVAKQLGFTTIVAVCSTRNMDFCSSLGATHVIDYTKKNVVEDLRSIVGDGGVDIVMDCVTSGDPADQVGYPQDLLPLTNTRYIRLGGNTPDWFWAGLERFGWKCFGKEKLFWIRFPHSSDELKLMTSWCEDGNLKPTIEKVVPFTKEGVEGGFGDLLMRRVKGKIVIKMKNYM